MGLESFTSEESSSNYSSSGRSKTKTRNEWYICLWNGKESLSEGYKEITIEDKDKWNKIIDFIEEEFGITEDELMELSHQERFELVNNTKRKLFFDSTANINQKRECIVCGTEFIFPQNWDFLEYEGDASCRDHTIREIKDALEEEEEEEDGS